MANKASSQYLPFIKSSSYDRVLSNFSWTVLSEAIAKGSIFVANIYIARTLGVENFGLFVLAQTITFYVWLAVDLGTNLYGIREIARDKANAAKIINDLMTIRVSAGVMVFAVYILSVSLMEMPSTDKVVFAACGVYLLTYAFYADWILKGFERFKYIFFGGIATAAVFVFGNFIFVRSREDVVAASLLWSFSYLFGSLTLLYVLLRRLKIRLRPSFDLSAWKRHIKESIYFTMSGGLMVLYQYVPILFLSLFFTTREIGLFSAPYRLVLTIVNAGFMLPASFYPVFSDLYRSDRQRFDATHKRFKVIMLVLGLVLVVSGALLSDEIILFVFGEQYYGSLGAFSVIIWLIPLYFIRFAYSSVLLATGFQRLQVLGVLAGVIGVCLFGLLLIPGHGVQGAAISLVASETLIVMVMVAISRFALGGNNG